MHCQLEDRPPEVRAEEVEPGRLADQDQLGGHAGVEHALGPDALLHVAGHRDQDEVPSQATRASRTARIAITMAASPAFMSRTPAP